MPELLRLNYANGRRTLVIEADLGRGWEPRQNTYGFHQLRWVPFAVPRDRDSHQRELWEKRLAAIHDNDQIVRIEQRVFADVKIKCQVTFIAQPATFADAAARPPTENLSADLEHCRLKYTEGLLRAEVDFLDHPWRLTQDNPRRPHIFKDARPFHVTAANLWYDVTILLVFHGLNPHQAAPVEREYGDGVALPGGLPETNRRRH